MRKSHQLAAFATLALAATAQAYLFMSDPVDDALTRAAARVKDHPTQPESYFFLARINGSAWAKGATGKGTEVQIASFGNGDAAPFFVPWDSLMYQRPADKEVTPEARQYLLASLLNYRKAVELDGKNPLFHLGLAWACEQAATCRLEPPPEIAGPAPTPDQARAIDAAIGQLADGDFARREQAAQTLAAAMPGAAKTLQAVRSQDPEVMSRVDSILQNYWLAQAVANDRLAYTQAVDADLKAEQFRDEADHTISVVAGKRLLVLLPAQPDTKPGELKDIQLSLELIEAKPKALIMY